MYSRVLARRMELPGFVDRFYGVGGSIDPTDTPLKPEPTIVTQADIMDYAQILTPLIKSLHSDDMLEHLIYMDPSDEHRRTEELIADAQKVDGCTDGLGCPGWRDDEPQGIPGSKAYLAAKLRREAFTHRVNARFMEDRIAERGKKVTNDQIRTEKKVWEEWLEYEHRFMKFLDSLKGFTIVKSSDFLEMQRFDLEYQWFRRRYTQLTGFQPTRHLTVVPKSSSIPWFPIIAFAGIAAGLWYLWPVLGGLAVVGATRPAAAKVAVAA